ncbi:MAG: hypothetical protein K9K32_05595 [Halanaerobiales bacterium]|nr:hypothetical protein [Halanaerobiales bacterium]
MKSFSIFSGTTIGILLIFIGLTAILKTFDIEIPFVRILIGLLIIYVGVTILFGGTLIDIDHNTIIFSNKTLKVTDFNEDEYNIIFGSGVIDLSELPIQNHHKEIEINTIFGFSSVLLDSKKPIRLDVSSVFGIAETPDGNKINFGDYEYTNIKKNDNYILNLKSSVVFGNSKIKYSK